MLLAKYKNSKSIKKLLLSPSYEKRKLNEEWTVQLNNNKNINDFCLKLLVKTERHISLAHLHLLSTKMIPQSVGKIIPHVLARPTGKNHPSCAFTARPAGKNHPSFAGPACWKNHLSSARRVTGLGPGFGPCRPLV